MSYLYRDLIRSPSYLHDRSMLLLLFTAVLKNPRVPQLDDQISEEEAAVFWAASLLGPDAELSQSDQWFILSAIRDELYDLGRDCSLLELPDLVQLVIVTDTIRDKFYTVTGRRGFIDLKTGVTIAALRHPVLKSVSYNLTANHLHYMHALRHNPVDRSVR